LLGKSLPGNRCAAIVARQIVARLRFLHLLYWVNPGVL
jgi:hypothetical protein